MTTRNLNPFTFFDQAGLNHKPKFSFRGRTPQQFKAWQKALLPQLLDTLGTMPKKVAPNPELLSEWSEDGLIKQRWVIDVQPNLAATLLLYRPADLKRGEKRPAILACHGHGPLGKDGPMGNTYSPEGKTNVAAHNYDYGLQMARKGFVTYSIDWLGFGERDIKGKPHYYSGADGRDPCNIYYLCATMMGTTVLGMNLHDGMRATDFVASQPFVDASKLGVMGLSLGGTMTTWMALIDKRFKAVNVICYAGPFHEVAYRTYNVCGSQVTPGVYALADIAELQGLIAPRPLLCEIGIHDSCFFSDHTQQSHKQVERIYKAAGVADKLDLDLFPGEHAWGGNKSEAFFRRHLAAKW